MKIAAFTVVGLIAMACSAGCGDSGSGSGGAAEGGDSSNGGDSASGGDDANGGTINVGGATGDGGTNPSGNTVTTGSGTPGCGSEGDFQACAQCFAAEDPAGAQAYQGTLLAECACTNPEGDCYATCSADPVCSGQQPGAECNACIMTISNGSACVEDFSAACMADAACNAFGSSLAGCPQN